MVRSAQTMHLSCIKISTISKRTKTSFHLSLIIYEFYQVKDRFSYLASKMITELPLEPRHLGELSGAYKTICEPMVRLAQMVLLSCSDTNTITERTKTRFHMSHITQEFHRLRLK
jgi:hypothetical protein